jgi:tripartite-type tricarboxylate transporter receptor subunit TctC
MLNPTNRCFPHLVGVTLTALLVIAGSKPAAAESSVEQFYKGNTLKIHSSQGPGSGYTLWARFIGAHYGKFIPGQPTIVVDSMPGAGGVLSANYIYAVAPKNGTEIAALAREAAGNALMGAPGVKYDALKLNWIGTPTSETHICVASKTSPIHTLDDLYHKEFIVGSDGVGSGMHVFPAVLSSVLGMKFKPIAGYSDSGEVLLAVDRGEVHGVCQSADTLTRARGPQLASGDWKVLFQGALKKSPKFPDAPLVLDLAKNDEQLQILKFLYSSQTFGRPYVTSPDVPVERVAALRKAFMDMTADPTFLAEAKKQGYDVSPVSGDEMTAMIKELAATPPDVIKMLADSLNPKK